MVESIESKDGFNGTSCKTDKETGGLAIAVFKSQNTTIVKSEKERINFMKVGENGMLARPYCAKCGTMLFNVYFPRWVAANRNELTTSDGSVYYIPEGEVTNIHCGSSFDTTKIPEPKHDKIPFFALMKFFPLLLGIGTDGSNTEASLIPEDIKKVEVSPITWE